LEHLAPEMGRLAARRFWATLVDDLSALGHIAPACGVGADEAPKPEHLLARKSRNLARESKTLRIFDLIRSRWGGRELQGLMTGVMVYYLELIQPQPSRHHLLNISRPLS
jgi:hypothetical protein